MIFIKNPLHFSLCPFIICLETTWEGLNNESQILVQRNQGRRQTVSRLLLALQFPKNAGRHDYHLRERLREFPRNPRIAGDQQHRPYDRLFRKRPHLRYAGKSLVPAGFRGVQQSTRTARTPKKPCLTMDQSAPVLAPEGAMVAEPQPTTQIKMEE